ncbi:MAG: hypothetical protein QW422_01395 [Sulfolobales archaeon]
MSVSRFSISKLKALATLTHQAINSARHRTHAFLENVVREALLSY